MTVETVRDVALGVVTSIGAGTLTLSAFTDDATWWMLGQGTLPVSRMDEIIRSFHASRVAGQGRMEIVGVTAEEDRVAIEGESTFPLHDGTIYQCSYHFLLRFEGDKVREVREYFDTAHAAATFAPKQTAGDTA